MERARNSDSETHVKKYNWTSGTDLSKKTLWDIFFGAPCTYMYSHVAMQMQQLIQGARCVYSRSGRRRSKSLTQLCKRPVRVRRGSVSPKT